MARWSHVCAVALTLASAHAIGAEIRHIEVQSFALSPESEADAKRDLLKRGSAAVPSPILVDQVARIAGDGSLQLGCDNRAVRDFREVNRSNGDEQ
jgi:predicted secreted Zn-dependent protease